MFALNSCKTNSLIVENTKVANSILARNDSLLVANRTLNNNFINSTSLFNPDLNNHKRINFESFYNGKLVSQEIIERRGSWIKIKLRQILISSNLIKVKETKQGWLLLSVPDVIYHDTTKSSTEDLHTEAIEEMLKPYKVRYTNKPDLLSQKEIDLLLCQNNIQFDGMRFDSKRFDYADLSNGSFRGTYFNNCNLSKIMAIRQTPSKNNDFYQTRFEGGINIDWTIANCKFEDFQFENGTIENSSFIDCIFKTNTSSYAFNNMILKKVYFINDLAGYITLNGQKKTSYQQCSFKNVKNYATKNFNITYLGSFFNNCLWHGMSFDDLLEKSRITGGSFINQTIIGGEFKKFIIEPWGGFKPIFQNLTIFASNFNSAQIDGEFGSKFRIYGACNFSFVNFATSRFVRGTFGDSAQTSLTNITNANFQQCEFVEHVKFIKCDLRGTSFPVDTTNIDFICCKFRD